MCLISQYYILDIRKLTVLLACADAIVLYSTGKGSALPWQRAQQNRYSYVYTTLLEYHRKWLGVSPNAVAAMGPDTV